MSEPRFRAVTMSSGDRLVVDIDVEAFNALEQHDRRRHCLVRIQVGVVSPKLADVWVRDIAAKLNQFDIGNAAVAKLT